MLPKNWPKKNGEIRYNRMNNELKLLISQFTDFSKPIVSLIFAEVSNFFSRFQTMISFRALFTPFFNLNFLIVSTTLSVVFKCDFNGTVQHTSCPLVDD